MSGSALQTRGDDTDNSGSQDNDCSCKHNPVNCYGTGLIIFGSLDNVKETHLPALLYTQLTHAIRGRHKHTHI